MENYTVFIVLTVCNRRANWLSSTAPCATAPYTRSRGVRSAEHIAKTTSHARTHSCTLFTLCLSFASLFPSFSLHLLLEFMCARIEHATVRLIVVCRRGKALIQKLDVEQSVCVVSQCFGHKQRKKKQYTEHFEIVFSNDIFQK